MSNLIEAQDVLGEVGDLLGTRHIEYGDSIFKPINIFSDLPADKQQEVLLDQKLSRQALGGAKEDTLLDLIGYLAILISTRRRGGKCDKQK